MTKISLYNNSVLLHDEDKFDKSNTEDSGSTFNESQAVEWVDMKNALGLGILKDTGTLIDFATKVVFNTVASPGTGNFTEDQTGAVFGNIQKIYHDDTVAPSFPGTWVQLGDGAYFPNELNIIYAEFVDEGTRVEYWITQEN